MEEGPWQYKGKTVVGKPYDGFTRPLRLLSTRWKSGLKFMMYNPYMII